MLLLLLLLLGRCNWRLLVCTAATMLQLPSDRGHLILASLAQIKVVALLQLLIDGLQRAIDLPILFVLLRLRQPVLAR
uniref:Putative secreted protein n=1 Tax=Anopheles marajoara TaxID=58244 RepID=A0A2M4CCA1_9DIPT